MKKFIVLLALCVCSLLADKEYIQLGAFEVRAVASKDGVTVLEIFKDKKPFQTIRAQKFPYDWTNEACDESFLFGWIDDEKSFGFKCNREFVPLEYRYEKNKFVYAGGLEEFLFFNEIKETQNFYIALDYKHDSWNKQSSQYDVTGYDKVHIIQKPSNKIVQTIEGNLSGDAAYCEGNCIAIEDYNFDGFEDFSLLKEYGRTYSASLYFLYDPKKKEFFLSEIDGENLLFDQKTKTITSFFDGRDVLSRSTYKLENNKLKLIKESCYIEDIEWGEGEFEHNCEYSGGFIYLSSVGLKKNFELKIAISTDKKKGVVRYKGQKEFIDITLKQKSQNELIFDEKYKGTIMGAYTLSINDYGVITKASYARKKDGKKFELENIYLDENF
ncbi:MAG: hypothetical protein LBQ18_04020 [Campylobacteraceae bacterium]|jgi:hypothetical protein|nr:hypothetical protein [Campylobacteraceae bacterium]